MFSNRSPPALQACAGASASDRSPYMDSPVTSTTRYYQYFQTRIYFLFLSLLKLSKDTTIIMRLCSLNTSQRYTAYIVRRTHTNTPTYIFLTTARPGKSVEQRNDIPGEIVVLEGNHWVCSSLGHFATKENVGAGGKYSREMNICFPGLNNRRAPGI